MADQWYGGQSSSGERWNVNLPAVVGVVFVFLLGVVVWVVASSGGDDDAIQTGDSGVTTLPGVTTTTLPATTSPQPMPVTTPVAAPTPTVPATAAPTVPATVAPTAPPPPPPTQPPDTTAIPAPTTAAPATTVGANGDLGVPGHPISRPACDGSYITVIASAVGAQATASSLDSVLDRYAGSSYLRTDQTCPSLTPAVDGEPIYVIYLGPYGVDADACRARSQGPSGAYVRRLSNDLDPSHSVTCA